MIPKIRIQRMIAAQEKLRAALDSISESFGIEKVSPAFMKYAADREMAAAEALAEQAELIAAHVLTAQEKPKRGRKPVVEPEPELESIHEIPEPVVSPQLSDF